MQQPNQTQSSSSSLSAASTGDDVMRIIADVESQMQRIRSAQRTQDDALTLLAQRTRSLEQAEDEIARTRRQLGRDLEKLQVDQQSLESASQQLAQQTACQQEQISQQRKTLETDQADLKLREAELNRTQSQIQARDSELHQEKSRLAQLETQCRSQQQELALRTADFDKSRQELQQRVEQAERNVGELISRLETADAQLTQRQSDLEKVATESRTIQRRVRDLEQLLHEETDRADHAERDTAELAKLADQQRADVESQLAQANAEIRATQESRDAALAEATAAREQVSSLRSELAQLGEQLALRDTHLSDIQKKFEMAGKRLSDFAAILAEQTPQVERGASALVMVEQQQQQIERLAKELAEYKLRVDPAEMQRRDQRIVELTEALRQARGQSAGGAGVGEVEQRNAALMSEVNHLKVEVEKLTLANEEAQRQLHHQANAESAGQAHEAIIAEHNARTAALNAEIQRLQSSSAAELQTQLEQQSRLHEQRLAESHQADIDAIATLTARIAELEVELSEARQSGSKKKGAAQDKAESKKLREKAEKISAVAEHLRRRRTRLEKLRKLIIARSVTTTDEQSPEQALAVNEQKQQIVEARRALAEAEKEMVRRWARPRAAATMVWVIVLAGICAGVSWLLADHLFPAHVTASVVLEARNSLRTPLPDEQAEDWRTWHSGLLADSTFMQVLSKRLAERRLDGYSSPESVSRRIDEDLTIDDSQKGAMILTLAGFDEEETTAVLDVIATTAAAESNRHHGNRNDSAWAVVTGERNDDGRTRYATVNAVPISDERFKSAGIIFAVMFVTVLGFIAVIYTRLSRAKRVFEQENASLFSDARLTTA